MSIVSSKKYIDMIIEFAHKLHDEVTVLPHYRYYEIQTVKWHHTSVVFVGPKPLYPNTCDLWYA
jgi:hypothetical protein